ncbi:hypothetical protein AVEN_248682-1 [Araneus ventricosus]|uniref:Uncharacterized protein n=1 Tax=Araneus ventricosus TaxID=182803 RepID=A0A4Y2C0S8_ARAVE|nr:hypothetical protein AVEN_248682-1 [Araneus ventricosus]
MEEKKEDIEEGRGVGGGSFVRVRSCARASKSRYSSSDDTTEWNSINASKPLTHKMRKAFLDIAVTRIHLFPFLSAIPARRERIFYMYGLRCDCALCWEIGWCVHKAFFLCRGIDVVNNLSEEALF